MPQPILFPVTGVHVSYNGTGLRGGGVAPNFCGGRLMPPTTLTLSGTTKDDTGAAVGGFTVYLFDMTNPDNPVLSQTTTSDGSGNYSFSVGRGRYWAVSYKTGSPDKTGSTLNTLAGV